MSFINTQDIYNKWIYRNESKKFTVKYWNFSENMLTMYQLKKFMFYLVNIYLFIYELVKHIEIVEIFYYQNDDTYMNKIAFIMNTIVLENKIKTILKQRDNDFIIILILVIQLFLYLYHCFLFILHNRFQIEEEINNLQIYIFNSSGFLLLIIPYSLNYINLFIISFFDSNENSFIYYFNICNTILFNLFYILYCFSKNDVSPNENMDLFSVSNPVFHIITYSKFILYNIITMHLTFIPGHFVFVILILFHLLFLYLIIYKFYIIHRICYLSTLIKTLLFLNLFCINFFYFVTSFFFNKNNFIHNLSVILCSVILTFLLFPYFNNLKKDFIYKFNKYEKLRNCDFISDEFYMYQLLNKQEINYRDYLKHKHICSSILSENCICRRITFLQLNNQDNINQLKELTCLYLSKLRKNPSIFDLFYLNNHLSNKKINHSLFLFLMKFKITNINQYCFHFLVRIVKNFIKIYNYFYNTNQTKNTQFNKSIFTLKTLNLIILYEYNFRKFLKKIKTALNASSSFWEVVKNKPINYRNFLNFGNEFTECTLIVCKYFGMMQKIQPNQIKLLKTYTFFIRSVINDHEYVNYLINLINRCIQIQNPSFNISKNFIEKDLGLLIISGQIDKLFKVLSYNKFSKNFFGKKITLKQQDIHHLQPFPFNIYHVQYLKQRFDISYLSEERVLYCIDENMDLNLIITNTIPCLDLEGKINFFMTFYLHENNSSMMIALVDHNGCVFASTQTLKREFRLSINFNFMENIELFQKYNGTYSNYFLSIVDFIELVNSEENNSNNFPYIYNKIRECSVIFKKINETKLSPNLCDFGLITKRSLNLNKHKVFENLRRMATLEKSNVYNAEPSISEQIINKINEKAIQPKSKISSLSNSFNTPRLGVTERSKDPSVYHSEVACENYENIKLQTTINRYKTKFHLKITEKKVLSGMFSYYYVDLKKIQNNQDSNVFFTKNKVSFLSDNPANKENLKTFEDGLETETYFYDKINPTSFLINYESENIQTNSQSKIFKLIFFSLAIIFLILIIIYFVWFAFSLYCNNKYKQNYEISKGFLMIREKIFMIVANTEFIHKLRLLRKNVWEKEIEERYNYLKTSVIYDINSLFKTLEGLVLIDFTNYPFLKDLVRGQNFQMGQFRNNKMFKFQNYSLFQGLDVFLSEIKEFIDNDNSFSNNKNVFFYVNDTQSTQIDNYEKNFEAIFLNYFLNIIHYLEKINQVNYEESTNRIDSIYFFLELNFISYLVLFVIIAFLIFIINRFIYLVHLNLLKFYYLPPHDFIQNMSNYLKKVKKIIFNLKNDSMNIYSVEELSSTNKNAKPKNLSKLDMFNARKSILLFNHNFSYKDNAKKNSIISFGNAESNLHKSEANLINNITITSNNENQNLMEKSQLKLPKNTTLSWDTNFYSHFLKLFIKLYLKGIYIQFSFFYIFLAFLILHPLIKDRIYNITFSHYSLIYKTESEFLLTSSVLLNIFKNSTILDINNVEINKEYSDIFMKFHYGNPRYNILNDEIRRKLIKYNSNEFCTFFLHNMRSKIFDPNISSNECENSPLNLGIQIYIYKLKTSVEGIYNNFKYSKNRTNDFLKSSLNDYSFRLTEISFNYYIRNYLSDIELSLHDDFESIIKLSFWVSLGILILFSIHISVLIYLAFFVEYRRVYFYFEKIRILFCILPENKNENDDKLRQIFQEYY